MDEDVRVGSAALAELIWQHTGRQRAAAHRRAGQARCWTRRAPYGSADPRAEAVRAECRQAGCLDLVHDIYAAVGPRIAALPVGQVRDGGRFANAVVAREVADHERRSRVASGLPAKPARTDGVAGRVIAALEATGDDGGAARLVAMFEAMQRWAAGGDPGRWPIERWTAERRAAGSVADVAADIATVSAVAERVAGPTWIRRHLDPGRRPVARALIEDLGRVPAGDTDLLWGVFRGLYVDARARGVPAEQALRHSAERVFGYRVVTFNSRLRDLVAEIEPVPAHRLRRPA